MARSIATRFILRSVKEGATLMAPSAPGRVAEFLAVGEPLAFPSYMAALRGRALRGLPHEIAIIQQEREVNDVNV